MTASMKFWMLAILVLLIGSASFCLAQGGFMKVYTDEGILISEGSSANPAGELGVTTYRLERIKLKKPVAVKDNEQPLESVFRLTVFTREPLPLGDYSIWIDDFQHDAIQTQPHAASIIIYARTLPNGLIRLALSKRGENDPDARSVLPETIGVPPEFAQFQEEVAAQRPIIKLRRLPEKLQICP